jgi:hypothetical protein
MRTSLIRARLVHPLLVLAVATLASTAWQGFDFPVDNNTFHVPILLDYAGSAEGPHDAVTGSLGRYVSLFWQVLAPVATERNLFALFLTLHIAVRFATAFFVWRLAVALGGASRLSVAFAGVFLFLDSFVGRSPLGRNEILEGYLTHSQVVIPVVLAAWLLAVRERPRAAGAVMGLAFNINAFAAIWGALALGAAMIVRARHRDQAAALKDIAASAGLYLILAAPTVVWIVLAVAEVPPHAPFSHGAFLREYYGYHYFIDMQWKEAAVFLLAALVGLALTARAAAHWDEARRETVLCLYGAYGAVVAFGAGAPYVIDHRLLFALNPMRMDAYLLILIGVVVLAWCIAAFRAPDRAERAAAVIALMGLADGNLALLAGACLLPGGGALKGVGRRWIAVLSGAVALAHLGFGSAPVIDGQAGPMAVFWFLLQAGAILYLLMKAGAGLEEAAALIALALGAMAPGTGSGLALALALCVYGAAFALLLGAPGRRALALAAAGLALALIALSAPLPWLGAALAALLVPVLSLLPLPWPGRLPEPPASSEGAFVSVLLAALVAAGGLQMAARGGLSSQPAEMRAFTDVQLWARGATPPGTVFLPVGVSGFSVLSRRPVWTDWQSGGMVMWAPEAHETWWRRWRRLRAVASVDAARRLAVAEGITYIVFDMAKVAPRGLPARCIAYRNARFWVLGPCPGGSATPGATPGAAPGAVPGGDDRD